MQASTMGSSCQDGLKGINETCGIDGNPSAWPGSMSSASLAARVAPVLNVRDLAAERALGDSTSS